VNRFGNLRARRCPLMPCMRRALSGEESETETDMEFEWLVAGHGGRRRSIIDYDTYYARYDSASLMYVPKY